MRLFERVAIVGTGLIGGSIALDIKKHRLADQVIGVTHHKNTASLIKRKKIVDIASCSLRVIEDADLVILALPVGVILELVPRIAQIIKPSAIVTDVGSTKREVVWRLDKVFSKFVGAHPLGGSEKRSAAFAASGIFKKSICIITPTAKTDKKALAKIKQLWQKVGARIAFLSPEDHDRILSYTSHLPHITAFSLINTVPKEYLKLSAGGLKGTTRIAASGSQLWSDIFLSNRKNILKTIALYENNLALIKKAINKNDRKALDKFLEQAKAKRNSLG
jgi:prephenate dehydrogenase